MTNATDERTANDSVSIDADCSEVWRLAGEFFGNLQSRLRHGTLIMLSRSPGMVDFQWDIRLLGKRFGVENQISFATLRAVKSIEALAEVWADDWKNIISKRT